MHWPCNGFHISTPLMHDVFELICPAALYGLCAGMSPCNVYEAIYVYVYVTFMSMSMSISYRIVSYCVTGPYRTISMSISYGPMQAAAVFSSSLGGNTTMSSWASPCDVHQVSPPCAANTLCVTGCWPCATKRNCVSSKATS